MNINIMPDNHIAVPYDVLLNDLSLSEIGAIVCLIFATQGFDDPEIKEEFKAELQDAMTELKKRGILKTNVEDGVLKLRLDL